MEFSGNEFFAEFSVNVVIKFLLSKKKPCHDVAGLVTEVPLKNLKKKSKASVTDLLQRVTARGRHVKFYNSITHNKGKSNRKIKTIFYLLYEGGRQVAATITFNVLDTGRGKKFP